MRRQEEYSFVSWLQWRNPNTVFCEHYVDYPLAIIVLCTNLFIKLSSLVCHMNMQEEF